MKTRLPLSPMWCCPPFLLGVLQARGQLIVQTPESLTSCEYATLEWSNGEPPFTIDVLTNDSSISSSSSSAPGVSVSSTSSSRDVSFETSMTYPSATPSTSIDSSVVSSTFSFTVPNTFSTYIYPGPSSASLSSSSNSKSSLVSIVSASEGDSLTASGSLVAASSSTSGVGYRRSTGSPLEILFTQQNGSYSWLVDMAPGSKITIQVTDSNGLSAQSSPIRVLPSCFSSTDCGFNASSSASRITCPSSHPTGSASIGAISGGVVGGVAVLCLFVVVGVPWWRRRRAHPSLPRLRVEPWDNGVVDLLDKSEGEVESPIASPLSVYMSRPQHLDDSTTYPSPLSPTNPSDRDMLFTLLSRQPSAQSASVRSMSPVVEHAAESNLPTHTHPSGRPISLESRNAERDLISPAPTYSSSGQRDRGRISPAPTYRTIERSSPEVPRRAPVYRPDKGGPSNR